MYILLLVATSTPTVMPTLNQMMPTTTVMSTPTVMPTLDQMMHTTTVMSTPIVTPTLDQTMPTTTVMPKSAEMPKQVVRQMSVVKTPNGVYTSLSLSVQIQMFALAGKLQIEII